MPMDCGDALNAAGEDESTKDWEIKETRSASTCEQQKQQQQQLSAWSAAWQVLQLLFLAEAFDVALLLLLSLLQIPVFARVGSVTGLFYRALVDLDLAAFHAALLQAALWLALAAVAASLQDWAAQFVSIRWRRVLTSKCHAAYCRPDWLYGTVTGIVRVCRRGDGCEGRKRERGSLVQAGRSRAGAHWRDGCPPCFGAEEQRGPPSRQQQMQWGVSLAGSPRRGHQRGAIASRGSSRALLQSSRQEEGRRIRHCWVTAA